MSVLIICQYPSKIEAIVCERLGSSWMCIELQCPCQYIVNKAYSLNQFKWKFVNWLLIALTILIENKLYRLFAQYIQLSSRFLPFNVSLLLLCDLVQYNNTMLLSSLKR